MDGRLTQAERDAPHRNGELTVVDAFGMHLSRMPAVLHLDLDPVPALEQATPEWAGH